MISLSVYYFKINSEKLSNDNIIIYSADNPECLREKMYPMCYISSHSDVFIKLLNLDVEWCEFVNTLDKRNEGWYTDQKYIFEKINFTASSILVS